LAADGVLNCTWLPDHLRGKRLLFDESINFITESTSWNIVYRYMQGKSIESKVTTMRTEFLVLEGILCTLSCVRIDNTNQVPETCLPRFFRYQNPPCVLLDLDNPLTVEGMLKAAVVQKCDDTVGVVAAIGMPGTGKTCALRAIVLDPTVISRFPGGIYFIPLGQGATPENVTHQLATYVKKTGGVSKLPRLPLARCCT
jgi:hypothetical protein